MKNIIISLCALLAFSTVGCVKQTIERVKVKRASVIHLKDYPPSIDEGNIGDYYIDRKTGLLYGPKTDERGWGNTPIRLVSEKGINPNTIRSGKGAPDLTVGKDGDLYLDTQNQKLYGPKKNNSWGVPYTLGDSNPWHNNQLSNYKLSDDRKTLLAWLNPQTVHIDMRADVGLSRITAIQEKAFSYQFGAGGHEGVFTSDPYAVKTIILPATVTEIGKSAFEGLYHLEMLTLPRGLTKIPRSMCNGCERLSIVNFEEGITEIEDFAFARTKIEKLTIPRSVKEIRGYAFAFCDNLDELKLQEGLKKIAAQAFLGCEKLKVIDIPESVTSIGSIGDFSFSYCPVETVVLHSRTIPKFSSVEVSFRRTLKNVYVPDESLELYKKSDWADDAFKAKIKPMSQRH